MLGYAAPQFWQDFETGRVKRENQCIESLCYGEPLGKNTYVCREHADIFAGALSLPCICACLPARSRVEGREIFFHGNTINESCVHSSESCDPLDDKVLKFAK